MKSFSIEQFAPLIAECSVIGEQKTEEILHFLKAKNCSVIESIRILMEIQNISLPTAKQIVHKSKAWAEHEAYFDSIHDHLEKLSKIEE